MQHCSTARSGASAAATQPRGSWVLRCVLGLLCALLLGPVAAQPSPAPATASDVGEAVCLRCHASENNHFGHTVHARAFRQNPRNERERLVCEACHGPGSRHVANAVDRSALIGFTRTWGTPVDTQNAQCLGCHQGRQRIYWPDSVHAASQLGCSDCHNPMARFSAGGLLKKAGISETCYGCHQQQRAEFRKRSHMPLPEGKMSCESCHNPHGSPTRPMLKANAVNDLCTACHAEKRGPFIWEHAPVRENCMNCHEAHGSNHEALLVAPRPFLCQQCHTNRTHQNKLLTATNQPGGADPSERLMARGCQTCHAQIHGSNHPAGVRFLR
ncbi:DmsE family decaheme c-type cytochrome [Aquabacterium sp.]|uniref:DmsE family decaheme c-type cytochrome n=1 Tax=Aquabacterium sp. TaxID=1872578 RepID=UPI002C37B1D0|nr:DmsE family decaheme c-type cytochrome [Aquabacterium sp.]HSW03551.1 DmsE family decaheme c-type cytochrome [Aquabacterium sp.]